MSFGRGTSQNEASAKPDVWRLEQLAEWSVFFTREAEVEWWATLPAHAIAALLCRVLAYERK